MAAQYLTVVLEVPSEPHLSEEVAQLLALDAARRASQRHPLAVTVTGWFLTDESPIVEEAEEDTEISDEEIAESFQGDVLPEVEFISENGVNVEFRPW